MTVLAVALIAGSPVLAMRPAGGAAIPANAFADDDGEPFTDDDGEILIEE